MENLICGLLKSSIEMERHSSEITVIQTVIRISKIHILYNEGKDNFGEIDTVC